MTGPRRVDVWRIDLDDTRWDALPCALSASEHARAQQFIQPRLASHFRRCRNALRHILSCYTGLAPASLALHLGPYGKPALAGSALHFNLSHSAGWGLAAVGKQPLGIDLEACQRGGLDVEAIAALACHPDEAAALAMIDDAARRKHGLLELWTRKEAYVKATGMGLQLELGAIRLAAEDGGLVCDANPGAPGGHRVQAIAAPRGFIASLCTAGEPPAVRYHDASCLLHAPAGGQEAQAEGQHRRIDHMAGL